MANTITNTSAPASSTVGELVEQLLSRADVQAKDSIGLSEVSELAQEADLSEDEVQALEDVLEARGVELRDDCGREETEPVPTCRDDLAVQTTDAMALFLQEVRRHPLLTRDGEVELAKRIERGDLRAKEQLVNSNLRLVISNARKFQGHELPLLDLIQEGILGLIRAAEKFDWRKGYKFSTYATFWIRQALQRALDNRSRTIRIPVHLGQRERKIARVQRELASQLGRDPTDRRSPTLRAHRAGGPRHVGDGARRDQPRPAGGGGRGDLHWARCWRAAARALRRRSRSACARMRYAGRWSGCLSPSARWSSFATASAGTSQRR